MGELTIQYRQLVKKNWIVKRRALKSTCCEFIVPTLVFLILAVIRAGSLSPVTTPASLVVDDPTFDPPPAYTGKAMQQMVCGTGMGGGPPGSGINTAGSIALVAPSVDPSGHVDGLQSFLSEYMHKLTAPIVANNSLYTCTAMQRSSDGRGYSALQWDINVSAFLDHSAIKRFTSEADMVSYIRGPNYGLDMDHIPVKFGVVFTSTTEGSWKYKFMSNSTVQDLGDTTVVKNPIQGQFQQRQWSKFQTLGWSTFQTLIDHYIISTESGVDPFATPIDDVRFVPFPVPASKRDDAYTTFGDLLGLFLVLGMVWPFSRLLRIIVEEKETKISESFKMIGIGNTTIWFSWATTYTGVFTIVCILCVVVGKKFFDTSDPVLIFLMLFVYCMSLVSLAVLLSAVINKAKYAGLYGIFTCLALYAPAFAVADDQSTADSKNLASLCSPTAIGLTAKYVLLLESSFVGVHWNNMSEPINHYSFGTGMLIMIFDTFLYLFLGWYLDKVIPSAFGSALPPYFLCMPSYWRKRKGGSMTNVSSQLTNKISKGEVSSDQLLDKHGSNVQEVNRSIAVRGGINIEGLYKSFTSGKQTHVAVKGLELTMYEGQIFVLLGHNGAGKTTTMNMLIGMIKPTAGTAKMNGLDINDDMHSIRQMLGVCPQHDVLLPTLTCEEHLRMFLNLKTTTSPIPAKEQAAMIQSTLLEVDLAFAAKQVAGTLSGGQRRRLSLAMALIGNSRFIVLDEPTSGVDPANRRLIWNLLKEKKKDRVIILTTHFMDEADYLGDRIGIMHKGELKCCGTSMFLKAKYGVGYVVTLTKTPKCDAGQVKEVVNRHVASAELLSNVGTELSFRLPFENTSAFPAMFDQLDSNAEALGVQSYGLSVTTMEEVFMRVAHETDPHAQSKIRANNEGKAVLEIGKSEQKITFSRHMSALIVKRFHVFKRDRWAMCCQIFLPLIILVCGLTIPTIQTNPDFAITVLDLKHFNQPLPLPHNDVAGMQYPRDIIADMTTSTVKPQKINGAKLLNFSTSLLATSTSNEIKESKYFGYFFTNDLAPPPAPPTPAKAPAKAPAGGMFGVSSSAAPPAPPMPQGGTLLLGNLTYLYTNQSAILGFPVVLNMHSNAKLDLAVQAKGKAGADFNIEVSIQPFPRTMQEQELWQATQGILSALVIAISFSFMPASYVVFVVQERETKSKLVQLISGVNIYAYWLANFAWDFACFCIPAIIAILVIRGTDNDAFASGENLKVVITTVFLYGLDVIPFTYAMSNLFKSHSNAQIVMVSLYIFSGAFLILVSFILAIIPSTREFSDTVFRPIFRLLPNYCLADTIFFLTLQKSFNVIPSEDPWYKSVAGDNLGMLGGMSIVYFILVLFIERFPGKLGALIGSNPEKGFPNTYQAIDEDVVAEEARVANGTDDIIVINKLRKVFKQKRGPKAAVAQLSFGIPKGQCFGFLGVNGAGKSTTLKMLTGDESPSSGTAMLNKIDAFKYAQEVRKLIGYCPQFDPLNGLLTAEETLVFYARIRGMPEAQIGKMVMYLCDRLTLSQDNQHTRPCGTYSGGNKRKLSVAMSLIGSPLIVFLDEPSTGMDPVSRRFMWDFISETMKERSVILTTHSMEECEALCERIGIITAGKLACIGTSQHLKDRFGKGFQFNLTVKDGFADATAAEFAIIFPGCKLVESFGGSMIFDVPKVNISIGQLFRTLESKKEQCGIIEYAVGQTTLEQIFISFADVGKHDEQPVGVKGGPNAVMPITPPVTPELKTATPMVEVRSVE